MEHDPFPTFLVYCEDTPPEQWKRQPVDPRIEEERKRQVLLRKAQVKAAKAELRWWKLVYRQAQREARAREREEERLQRVQERAMCSGARSGMRHAR